ncbi:MAG: acyl carrier protein [Acidobacteriota bacterium]|nr:acyl carrier protein [Acidobacteriota bacterium]
MENKEKYEQVFMTCFSLEKTALNDELVYNSISTWDSIGHMAMIAALEEAFDIMMDTNDIIDFSSYDKGIEILAKYDVKM